MDLHHKGGVTEEIVKRALVGTPLHTRKMRIEKIQMGNKIKKNSFVFLKTGS